MALYHLTMSCMTRYPAAVPTHRLCLDPRHHPQLHMLLVNGRLTHRTLLMNFLHRTSTYRITDTNQVLEHP